MTSQEKETTINFNEGDEIATVYTYNSAMKRKLAAFAAAYPDLCRFGKSAPRVRLHTKSQKTEFPSISKSR